MYKVRKRLTAGITALCMAVVVLALAAVLNASASEENKNYAQVGEDGICWQYFEDVSAYRATGNLTAPEPTNDVGELVSGYVFSGWYQESTSGETDSQEDGGRLPCTESLQGGSAWAKFVPREILSVKAQVSADLLGDEQSDTGSIRFVTTVDSYKYQKVGFYFTYNEATAKTPRDCSSNVVYTELHAVGKTGQAYVDKTLIPSDWFHSLSKAFKAWTWINVSKDRYDMGFAVTPYWVTMDGTVVTGMQEVRTINQGVESCQTPDEPKELMARIDYNYYTSLDQALAVAGNEAGVKIELLGDIEPTKRLELAKKGYGVNTENERCYLVKKELKQADGAADFELAGFEFNGFTESGTACIDGARTDAFVFGGGKYKVAENALKDVALGKEHTLTIETVDKIYIQNFLMVTMVIDNLEEFKEIQTKYFQGTYEGHKYTFTDANKTAQYRDGYFVLGSDINADGDRFEFTMSPVGFSKDGHGLASMGNNYDEAVSWYGVIDGRGYSVYNIDTGYGGVFGRLPAGSVIKNISFVGGKTITTGKTLWSNGTWETSGKTYADMIAGRSDKGANTGFLTRGLNGGTVENVTIEMAEVPGLARYGVLAFAAQKAPVVKDVTIKIKSCPNAPATEQYAVVGIKNLDGGAEVEASNVKVYGDIDGTWHQVSAAQQKPALGRGSITGVTYIPSVFLPDTDFELAGFTYDSVTEEGTVTIDGKETTAFVYDETSKTYTVAENALQDEALGGRHKLVITTEDGVVHMQDFLMVTKVIRTLDDFKAIKTKYYKGSREGQVGSTVTTDKYRDGYFVLDADINKDGDYFEFTMSPCIANDGTGLPGGDEGARLSWYGTIDGRGHVIYNVQTGLGGMFSILPATSVVKNLGIVGGETVLDGKLYYQSTGADSGQTFSGSNARNTGFLARGVVGATIENLYIEMEEMPQVDRYGVIGFVVKNGVTLENIVIHVKESTVQANDRHAAFGLAFKEGTAENAVNGVYAFGAVQNGAAGSAKNDVTPFCVRNFNNLSANHDIFAASTLSSLLGEKGTAINAMKYFTLEGDILKFGSYEIK